MELTKAENISLKGITSFPIDNIDTSWMTKSQKKFFEILKVDENKDRKYNVICELAGFKSSRPWYKAIKDERFVDLLENIGVNARLINDHYPSHNEVEFIKKPKEREEYLKNDIWDIRKLFEEYPRQAKPAMFIVKFEKICNSSIKNSVKRYFKNMLSNWSPVTFRNQIQDYIPFFDSMYELFPHIGVKGASLSCTEK